MNKNSMEDYFLSPLDKVKPRLLMHTCCAPCLLGAVERLLPKFDVTIFYYNPNISPKEEFNKRLYALETVIKHFDGLKLIVPKQNENEFLEVVKGLENCPEGGDRCTECFKLRLDKTAEYLKNHKEEFDAFATTLTVSPHKNAPLINAIGAESAARYGVEYLSSDLKKQEGFLRSTQLSKQLGIYRQAYCGCQFSSH